MNTEAHTPAQSPNTATTPASKANFASRQLLSPGWLACVAIACSGNSGEANVVAPLGGMTATMRGTSQTSGAAASGGSPSSTTSSGGASSDNATADSGGALSTNFQAAAGRPSLGGAATSTVGIAGRTVAPSGSIGGSKPAPINGGTSSTQPGAGGTKSTAGAAAQGGASPVAGSSAKGGTIAASGSVTKGGTVSGAGATSKGGAAASGVVAGGSNSSAGGANGSGGSAASSNDLWVAPNGSDANPGTESSPFATLTYAHSKVNAGQTIWLKSGTYAWSSTVKLTKNGTAANPIRVLAATGTRPVIDFSGQTCGDSSARGISITGTYWHLKGFDVKNAGDNCINIGGSYNTIEWVSVHGCCDSGLQISADTASDPTRGAYNTVLNCDAYENYDAANGGENADGFAPKLHIGPGNVFRGCRSWNNSDDGWDLFASDDVVVIDHCWAFLNGKLASGGGTSAGDGNGFKLGGAAASGDAYEGGAPHQVTNSFAFDNAACGFTRNNNTSVPILTDCGGRGDKSEYCSLTNPSPISFTMTGEQAKAVVRNPDGSLPDIR